MLATLNGNTIFLAIFLVIDMVNPKKVEKTANELIIKESESAKEKVVLQSAENLTSGEFLENFFELEQLARSLLAKRVAGKFVSFE